tara:strand:+ start:39 stop:335 length:297 start_codon:yes stop_codon:yes gene_type:complete
MIQALFLKQFIKYALPLVKELIEPHRKYCFEDNELDVKMRDIEKKCTENGFRVSAMQTVLKDLDDKSHPPAIDLEEWADVKDTIKKIKNKKAFKSLGK